ncbi:MAG: hypothetical protein V3U60_16035 [Gammaproteobacteria bacterium]
MKIAIDPGKTGAIAWCLDDDAFLGIQHMNMAKTIDVIFQELKDLRDMAENVDEDLTLYMEDVGFHRQGNNAQSSATFARHVGHLEMACVALQIPVVKVHPKVWIRKFTGKTFKNTPEGKKKRKDAIWHEALRQAPGIKLTKRNADAVAILLLHMGT